MKSVPDKYSSPASPLRQQNEGLFVYCHSHENANLAEMQISWKWPIMIQSKVSPSSPRASASVMKANERGPFRDAPSLTPRTAMTLVSNSGSTQIVEIKKSTPKHKPTSILVHQEMVLHHVSNPSTGISSCTDIYSNLARSQVKVL